MSDEPPADSEGQKPEYDPLAIPRRKVERFDQVMRDLPAPSIADGEQPDSADTINVNGYEMTFAHLGKVMEEYVRLKAADNWDWDPVRMGEAPDDGKDN